ncbi:MAG: hypothetical protein IKY67_13730 [Paludibacteraceae bacterium]|nr:hypothetical protein [Paludibacteraceae bacterium]
MRHIDEIISRIESLEDLPISEEMLGAYYESRLSDEESATVRDIIDSNLFLLNLEQEVTTSIDGFDDVGNCMGIETELLMSIELPEVFVASDMGENISCNRDDIQLDLEIEYTDLALDDICENMLENIDNQFENENIE